ncbi:MAG: pilus assembly protein N-terminal domain-containing protein [Deltaproteobacteria bacterium]|nr:pilus assembly protein N-terminal domain-containing protein [Deltaproteobacteria bacterium]
MRRFLLIVALALGALALSTSLAPTSAPAQTPQHIRVKVGSSTTMPIGGAPKEVSVENPEIATVEVLEDGRVKVTGVAEGNTTLIGIGADGGDLVMPIMVEKKE